MKYIIKNKKNWHGITILFILLAFPTLVLMSMIIESNYISIKEALLDSWLIIIILIGFDLYFLDCIFWQFKGYEDVEINTKELIIKRKGKILKDKFSIPISSIYSVQMQEYEPVTFFSMIFRNPLLFSKAIGETGGRILVLYGKNGKHKIDFGLGLTHSEAKLYVKQMTELLGID